MRTGKLIAPNGQTIVGTAEQVRAVADIDSVSQDERGKFTFNYSGNTEILWNSQQTIRRNDQTVMVCKAGDEWLLSDCKYMPDNA